jgi:hypothetical protein
MLVNPLKKLLKKSRIILTKRRKNKDAKRRRIW